MPESLAERKTVRNMAAVIFVGLGIVWLSQRLDIATAMVTGLVMVMTLIPLLVLSLSTYPKSWIGWLVAVTVVTIIDLFYYAG